MFIRMYNICIKGIDVVIWGIASSMTNKYALLSLLHNEVGHLITLLVASKFF